MKQMYKYTNSQKGIALPLVMIAILVGALVIPAFLGHVGTSLTGSRNYRNSLDAQYACDAAAEHAIWNVAEGSVAGKIPDAGQSTAYQLVEKINGLTPGINISNAWEVIARDDFESGGWKGGEGWLGAWADTGDAAVVTTGVPYEGLYHLRLRSTGSVSRSVDLGQQVNPYLRFRAKAESFELGDTATCRVSSGSEKWATLKTWSPADADAAYHYYEFQLNSYVLTDTFNISFSSKMDSTGDLLYIDDLDIVWPATTLKTVAADDFESGVWKGGTGWLGEWTNKGASSITADGHPYEGKYHILLTGPDGYVLRAVDLSAVSVAHLRFWAKANALEADDYAYCRVSSDGGDWTTVYTWTNHDADDVYRYYDIDLSEYKLTSGFWIAFEVTMKDADDYFYVDDVTLDAIDAYCITVNAAGRILKVAVDLLGGAKTVLCWWFVTDSTDNPYGREYGTKQQ
jgi:hypothetical protein